MPQVERLRVPQPAPRVGWMSVIAVSDEWHLTSTSRQVMVRRRASKLTRARSVRWRLIDVAEQR
jgi:hypothetical protein